MSSTDAYRKANPLGGPAAMFRTIAERLEAGEEYHAVLADYGLAHSEKPAQQRSVAILGVAEGFRTEQEARAGKTLQAQMREEIFRMRGKRAFLFQAAADRIDELEQRPLAAPAQPVGPSKDGGAT